MKANICILGFLAIAFQFVLLTGAKLPGGRFSPTYMEYIKMDLIIQNSWSNYESVESNGTDNINKMVYSHIKNVLRRDSERASFGDSIIYFIGFYNHINRNLEFALNNFFHYFIGTSAKHAKVIFPYCSCSASAIRNRKQSGVFKAVLQLI